MNVRFSKQGQKELLLQVFLHRLLQGYGFQGVKYILLFVAVFFVKQSVAQTEEPSDSGNAETVTPQPGKALKRYEILSNRITEDSIAQSNAIYEVYKLITKKIEDDSIAKLKSIVTSPAGKAKPVSTQKEKNSITQTNALTFDVGQVFSTFKFTGSQGNAENYTHNVTSSYSLGYQHSSSGQLFYRVNLGLRHAGASLLFDGVNYNWTLQYFDASAGAGYRLDIWRIKPYFSASPYFGYLLKANQTIGSANYDLLQNKSLNTSDFGLYFSPGVKLSLSDYICFYAEYKYILGLQNLEKSAAQKSYNRGFSFNLGIAITIENQ